jgi:hypothetical protein
MMGQRPSYDPMNPSYPPQQFNPPPQSMYPPPQQQQQQQNTSIALFHIPNDATNSLYVDGVPNDAS